MKYAIAPVLLAAAAVVQALGRYVYHQDPIVVVGEMFFPIFLAGVSVFYGLRGRPETFSTVKLAMLILAVVVALLTAVGWGMTLFWFYPSIWVYYSAFALLVITAVVAVISTPSAKQQRAEREGSHDNDDAASAVPDVASNPSTGAAHSKTSAASDADSDGWRTTRR
ncbi:hypothetical protein [Kocuria sp.]|uniref:hypothetical protein n=1 Tax=Kocuria sp. TaxID=1871328 RepID=UPI0026DED891|nr:hypothetical protein [Kocuria sp.]MDO5617841.1 hypothetical protein [Kocuria sp.]